MVKQGKQEEPRHHVEIDEDVSPIEIGGRPMSEINPRKVGGVVVDEKRRPNSNGYHLVDQGELNEIENVTPPAPRQNPQRKGLFRR